MSQAALVKEALCRAGSRGPHLVRVGYVVTQFLDGFHLFIQVISLNEITDGDHFFQWPVCAAPVVIDSHFFPSTAHIPLHSAHSPSHHGLVS